MQIEGKAVRVVEIRAGIGEDTSVLDAERRVWAQERVRAWAVSLIR